MFILFISIWLVIIGIWITQMPVSSGHTRAEVVAMLTLGCLVLSLGLMEVCYSAPTTFPIWRPFIISEAAFQFVNFIASTFLVAYFGYVYGDAWFSDSMLIMITAASNGLAALTLASLDIYILFQDKAIRLQNGAKEEKQTLPPPPPPPPN
ncbi:hypothetical protein BDD12DRAFT_813698 [Trichophaea hybrida]|nr:hypothetical protein BDD12DRAFT_813698 [Trichophaea hybrida]